MRRTRKTIKVQGPTLRQAQGRLSAAKNAAEVGHPKHPTHAASAALARADRAYAATKIRRPGNRNHTKDRGDLTELEFMVEGHRRQFVVAKTHGDNEHYDVFVDAGAPRVWRVQVKLSGGRHHRGYMVRSSWRSSHRQHAYSPKEVDFLAALIDGKGIWYLIPVRALGGRKTIHLYPFGARRGALKRFEKYREAWWLLEGKKKPGVGRRRAK